MLTRDVQMKSTSEWSKPFSINTVGTEGQLDIKVGSEKNDNEGANHPVKIEYKNIGINLSSTNSLSYYQYFQDIC